MSKRIWVGAALAAGLALAASPARAHDPWEFVGSGGDDTRFSKVSIGTGSVQVHDVDQTGDNNDQDWIMVPTLARHSYEARVSNTHVNFDSGGCSGCAQFERVGEFGALLTDDVATVNEGTGTTLEPYDRSVRWIATSNTLTEFVRITGGLGVTETANHIYTLRFWDTTYSIPRWNASNGQTTVVILSNLVQATVTGNVYFYNASGALVATQAFTLAQNATAVISTASLPALSGLSGHAQVAHTAGYGGLAGKAVALEPATGFTFDTAMTAVPQ